MNKKTIRNALLIGAMTFVLCFVSSSICSASSFEKGKESGRRAAEEEAMRQYNDAFQLQETEMGAMVEEARAEAKTAKQELSDLQKRMEAREQFEEVPDEYRNYIVAYAAEFDCPLELALAVAKTETNYSMDAVGSAGEVGIFQLMPGPGGAYHAEIEKATGLDPDTVRGNIAGGCWKLGQLWKIYGDYERAAMAYNMGEAGAASAWADGITSTVYSRKVKTAAEGWYFAEKE